MAPIQGTNGADVLEGTAQNDTMLGLNGNDQLVGSAGNDTMNGGSQDDFVVFTGAPSGMVIDLVAGTATGWGIDTLISIENVDGSMNGDRISLTNGTNFANGNGGHDTIFGLAGGDHILGGTGNDKIYGGSGYNEYLDGQDGNDFISGAAGNGTWMVGGQGVDTVSWAEAEPEEGLQIDLANQTMFTEDSYGFISQHIEGFENAEGSVLDDAIHGTGGANALKGMSGGDTIDARDGSDRVYGGDGADTAHGGNGNDTVWGDAANDSISGDAGNDTLYGGGGNDEVIGGDGNDRLFGGNGQDDLHGFNGADRFVFIAKAETAVGAADQVVDFFRSEGDKIDLSAIDAREGTSGNQAFSFVGTAAFSGTGQLHIVQQQFGAWLVEGNTDNDLQAEFQIRIGFAQQTPIASDFVI